MKEKVKRYNYVAIWRPQAWPTPTSNSRDNDNNQSNYSSNQT